MAERRPLSKRERFAVLMRDGFRCVYCGAHGPGVVLQVDHVQSVAGGGNHQGNLATACGDCNNGKGALCLLPPCPELDVLPGLIPVAERHVAPSIVALVAGALMADYMLSEEAEDRALGVCEEEDMEAGVIAGAIPTDPVARARLGLLIYEVLGRGDGDPVSQIMVKRWRERIAQAEADGQ